MSICCLNVTKRAGLRERTELGVSWEMGANRRIICGRNRNDYDISAENVKGAFGASPGTARHRVTHNMIDRYDIS